MKFMRFMQHKAATLCNSENVILLLNLFFNKIVILGLVLFSDFDPFKQQNFLFLCDNSLMVQL